MNILKKINTILGYISGLFILLASFVMLYDVVTRYLFKTPSLYASYIAAFLVLGAVFLGTAYALQAKGGHVNVEILVDQLKPLPRKICNTIGYVISMVFVFFLSKACYSFMIRAIENNWKAQGNLPIPSVILYGVMVLGSVLLLITLIATTIKVWTEKEGDV